MERGSYIRQSKMVCSKVADTKQRNPDVKNMYKDNWAEKYTVFAKHHCASFEMKQWP